MTGVHPVMVFGLPFGKCNESEEMETQETKKNGRGGYRPNSGRKKIRSKSIAIRVPSDVEHILDQQDSITEYIIGAVRMRYEKEKEGAV